MGNFGGPEGPYSRGYCLLRRRDTDPCGVRLSEIAVICKRLCRLVSLFNYL